MLTRGEGQMTKFTDKTAGYEQLPICVALKEFFDCYFIEKNFEKMLSLMADDFEGIGNVEEKVITNKEEFVGRLQVELAAIQTPIKYAMQSISGKEIAEGVWNVMAVLELEVLSGFEQKAKHFMHVTGSFKAYEQGFKVCSLHLSKTSNGLKKTQNDKLIYEIISKSMPGGIVIGYAEEGYPLCFANDRYLELLGYASYEEYYEDAGGLGTCHIHPDDLDMVNRQIAECYSLDAQFGIEYHIRHKDGHYISVYDIGKRMITPDNREIIICVLYDMTENARLKEVLIQESSYDALTGVFNRGGGVRAVKNMLETVKEYSFMFFDLDNLKLLNDLYSHEAGDHALKYFSELLMKYFVAQTILVRMGGDEFVAVLGTSMTMQSLQRIYTMLEQEYCAFVENNYPESHSSVSIGCVVGNKRCGFEELYHIADELMYDIKKHGKRGYKIVELNQ